MVLQNNYEGLLGIDEVQEGCTDKPITSVSDFTASYWQIKLAQNLRKYTAFKVGSHVYKFNAVPFGIKSSVSP